MSKKEFGDYYLGLDIGTNSVGWAVTDPGYNILKFNGKAMWGVHLFNEGNTAEERRLHRCARRRLDRRKQRLDLLKELMDSEVSAVDPNFFMRLDESNYSINDRKEYQPNSIFNDPAFKDKDYHKKFPTIYHLRRYLIDTNEMPDIRLVYLAIHHILKYRGHFLFEGISSDKAIPDFEPLFNELTQQLSSEFDINFEINENIGEIKKVIMDRNLTITDKKKILSDLFSADDDRKKFITTLLAGGKTNLSAIAEGDEASIKEIGNISLKDASIEENQDLLETVLGEGQFIVLELLKNIYDWGILSNMLNECKYISEAKIKEYATHKNDLALLKTILKAYATEHDNDFSLYNTVLKENTKGVNNYCAYSGMVKGSKGGEGVKFCTQEDFCAYLKKALSDFDFDRCDTTKEMLRRIENGTFMPKQRTKDNSVIPNSLHRSELSAILDNVSKFYPFLSEIDEKGQSIKEKILLLCTFRIPYYVGPLFIKTSNDDQNNAWAVHKEKGRVLPWNFTDKIDIDRTSEKFIERLVSRCTYLVSEKVLPKSSLMYQRYMLYNEINKIRINDEPISIELKKELIEELFIKKQGSVSKKDIGNFVTSRTGETNVKITGVDDKIKSSLKMEVKLKQIVGDLFKNRKMMEDIIRVSTIFGDDPKRLESKLKKEYGKELSKDQIKSLSKIKFKDWGNLSEKLLIGIADTIDGCEMNILTALERTNMNLMELLSDKYGYSKKIAAINDDISGRTDGKIRYSDVEELYCSPAIKHAIWRTVSIISEIKKITGHDPKKVFIETTREKRDDGRKLSRKEDLLKKYKEMKSSESFTEIINSLESTDEARLRSKKLYAYYCQEGHCMYCGKPIDLNDLGNNLVCDIDHIYPQSLKTDDSITNTVLSCRDCNITKSDRFPIDAKIQSERTGFWKHLNECGLISTEKLTRLTRKNGFTEDELNGFIARQLVETSQTVKAVADILKKSFDKSTDIVYVKGGNVSQFRQDQKDRGFYTKCRNVNDYHHAKDAYLNIVVGNVYDTKFTKDPLHIIRSEKYNLNKMFENDVTRDGNVAWVHGENGTIQTVDKHMRRNNILFTRAPYKNTGSLFNATIYKKGEGVHRIKKGMDIEKYGGYDSVAGSHFALVEHTVKKKRQRSIEYIPIMDVKSTETKENANEYFRNKGLIEPDTRITEIKIDSMFEIDGIRYSLSGRTANRLIVKLAEQLVIEKDLHNYCKKIYKFCDDKKNNKKSILKASDYELSQDMNIRLYSEILNKLNGKYKNTISFDSINKVINSNQDVFTELSAENQVLCLNQILVLLQCNSTCADLSDIKGPSICGKMTINKVLDTKHEYSIIYQSPTGLFEKKLDLSKK